MGKSYPIIGKITLLLYIVIFFFIRHIMLIFHFIVSKLYKPDVKKQPSGDPDYNLEPLQFSSNLNGYLTGDGAKFVGMAYVDRSEETWEQVKKFWNYEKKTFYRHDDPTTAFSGDMIVGMLLAISLRHREGKLTDEEKQFITEVVWKMTFNNLIPFKFEDVDQSRGYFWTPVSPGMNGLFHVLIMLKWGMSFGKWYQKIAFGAVFGILFLLNILLFLFGMYDHNVFYGKYYFCWWYGSHSDLITYAAGVLEKIPFAKKGIKILDKRYGDTNLDVAAVTCSLLSKRDRYVDVYSLATDFVSTKRGGPTPPESKALYYAGKEIRDVFPDYWKACFAYVKENGISKIFSYFKEHPLKECVNCWQEAEDSFLGGFSVQDYTWERSPQKRGSPSKARGDLDVRFALYVVEGALTENLQ